MMERALPDALVTGFENRLPSLSLPDPDDRHVLAAALHAGCDLIVTLNLRHFPPAALADHGIRAVHPDELLCTLLETQAYRTRAAVEALRSSLHRPPYTFEELLVRLRAVGLPLAAERLGKGE